VVAQPSTNVVLSRRKVLIGAASIAVAAGLAAATSALPKQANASTSSTHSKEIP
jgi:secreted PhoX family phosphatase